MPDPRFAYPSALPSPARPETMPYLAAAAGLSPVNAPRYGATSQFIPGMTDRFVFPVADTEPEQPRQRSFSGDLVELAGAAGRGIGSVARGLGEWMTAAPGDALVRGAVEPFYRDASTLPERRAPTAAGLDMPPLQYPAAAPAGLGGPALPETPAVASTVPASAGMGAAAFAPAPPARPDPAAAAPAAPSLTPRAAAVPRDLVIGTPAPAPAAAAPAAAAAGLVPSSNSGAPSAPTPVALPPAPSGGMSEIASYDATTDALLRAAMAMMASKNSSLFGAIGEGGAAGLEAYMGAKRQAQGDAFRDREMQLREAGFEQTVSQNKFQNELALANLDLARERNRLAAARSGGGGGAPNYTRGGMYTMLYSSLIRTMSPEQAHQVASQRVQEIFGNGGGGIEDLLAAVGGGGGNPRDINRDAAAALAAP